MELTINQKTYRLKEAHDISVPVQFDGKGAAEFGALPASRAVYKTDGFTGDVAAGGGCNCDVITFSPHLHGTHTECVGHIVTENIAVHEVLQDVLIPACLIRVTPQPASDTCESYAPDFCPKDKVITKEILQHALKGTAKEFLSALVIHTGWNIGMDAPPFFTIEAMECLEGLGTRHLLVDMPSIDRLDDDGHLTNHHIFWGIEQGRNTLNGASPSNKTVTEFVCLPGSLSGGNYLLNLQVAAFESDAAPSRPILYEIEK